MKDIEKLFNDYNKNINNSSLISEDDKNNSIASILERDISCIKTSDRGHSLISLIMEQLGFITKFALGWYLMWLGVMVYLIYGKLLVVGNPESMIAISLMPMLLMLFVVDDIAKIYLNSMMEIEFATKYSFGKVMMIRMIIMTVINFVCVVIASVLISNHMSIELSRLLLYGITPMMIFQATVLKCMEHFKGSQLKFICVVIYLLIAIGEFTVEEFIKDIYAVGLTSYWKMALVVAVVLCGVQFSRTRKVINNSERIFE